MYGKDYMDSQRSEEIRKDHAEAVGAYIEGVRLLTPFTVSADTEASVGEEVKAKAGPAKEGDRVVLPQHYTRFPIEPVYFIGENGLDFLTGNVVKYVLRSPYKNGIEDLKKARRYLDMMIARAEGKKDWAS